MNEPLAIIADTLGSPDHFRIAAHDPGQPGPGEARYAVQAAAVNFVDVLVAAGKYQVKPVLPFIPGAECAGIVEAVGEGVTHLNPGDRVFTSGVGNAFCQAAVRPAEELSICPASLSVEEAATFKVSYATAYYALVQRGGLAAGETVLVLGAAGGVGYAAIQVAKALGARVVGSASSAEKRELALVAGADEVVDSRSESWRADVAAAAGRAIDLVVDPVGGDATEPAFRSLGWKGRHLVIGFAGGGIPRLPTNLALLKGAALVGVDFRQFALYEAETAAANIRTLVELQASHGFRPHIGAVFPMERFAEAMALAASGQCVGRVVLSLGRG